MVGVIVVGVLKGVLDGVLSEFIRGCIERAY